MQYHITRRYNTLGHQAQYNENASNDQKQGTI